MPQALIHKPTKTLFLSTRKNKAKDKYATQSMAVFLVVECEEWKENFPMMAIAMPPEIGQVVGHGEHVFVVVRRAIDKETGQKRLWFCETATKSCGFYPMDECGTVDDLIDKWVEAIALYRQYKEDSAEYQNFIKRVPEPIRDLCIVRSFNKILEEMAEIAKEGEYF